MGRCQGEALLARMLVRECVICQKRKPAQHMQSYIAKTTKTNTYIKNLSEKQIEVKLYIEDNSIILMCLPHALNSI